jgi:predicted methyltransferase
MLLATVLAGCASAGSSVPPAAAPPDLGAVQADDAPTQHAPSEAYAALVAAPDRSDDDRKLDAGRHPAELLAFVGAAPGARVAELAAGSGYTTELLARAVGSAGHVYAQNSRWILERFAEKPFSARLEKPVMANVTRLDRDFESPFPDDVRELDAVVDVLFYHDTFWLGVDRDAMNRAVFAALKPGGVYVVIDHSGRAGTGDTEVKTLHRVEEQLVRDEILRAGFKLLEEGAFLKNPEDARDWSASPREAGELRGTSDRFALKFVKQP